MSLNFIRKNTYTLFDLLTAHAPIRQLPVFRLQPVYFYLLLYKTYVVGTHLRLPRLVEAIQMSINNICFYRESKTWAGVVL